VTDTTRLLAGRYEVGEIIGRGGMADVHVGIDSRLGRKVAIKLLRSSLASDPAFRMRFRQEAQSAARMAHPTIVRVFDAGEDTFLGPGGSESIAPFIVMEYVDGRMLKDIIREGPLAPDEAVRIIEGVLTALEYSHRAGVVHRDIKPGNIMITRTGQVKVMDFGIARAVSDSSATVAQTSAILGTAQYFSPEQAKGESVDARTDLYSTGIVLFEMLTGRPPFRGDTAVAVAYQHVSETPVAPSSLNPQVSPALDAVVLHALTKDRFDRYQSAAEFRADVRTASEGRIPTHRLPEGDASTLFGVSPTTSAPDLAMKRLGVDDDHVVRTQSRPPVAWIWAGILTLAVIVVAVVIWLLSLGPTAVVPETTRVVPDVAGATYESASNALEAVDLVPLEMRESSSSVPEGEVIRTDPEKDARVALDTQVDVYVSTGAVTVNVPSVVNMDVAAASTALEGAGLTVGSQTVEHSPNVLEGVVLRTDPVAGTETREGDVVNLIVSDGMVALPNVVGQNVDNATSTLQDDLQLQVAVSGDPSCPFAPNTPVSSQSLPPGAIPQKSAISIHYCTGRDRSTGRTPTPTPTPTETDTDR
jgi:eukaryotic-like serine/threonine-protein kinase